MSRHAETFSSSLSPGQKAYFVINGFDEPAVIGECPDFTSLTQQHPNAKFRLIDSTESVPVWSMSKIRGCHADLLIPNPDIFAQFARESEAKSHHLPWIQRADKVVFRGSSTGMGTSDSNLRVRVSHDIQSLRLRCRNPCGRSVNTGGLDSKFDEAKAAYFRVVQVQIRHGH